MDRLNIQLSQLDSVLPYPYKHSSYSFIAQYIPLPCELSEMEVSPNSIPSYLYKLVYRVISSHVFICKRYLHIATLYLTIIHALIE